MGLSKLLINKETLTVDKFHIDDSKKSQIRTTDIGQGEEKYWLQKGRIIFSHNLLSLAHKN